VRMGRMDAAVDNCDAHTAPCKAGERLQTHAVANSGTIFPSLS
jgi:hypothetical protein